MSSSLITSQHQHHNLQLASSSSVVVVPTLSSVFADDSDVDTTDDDTNFLVYSSNINNSIDNPTLNNVICGRADLVRLREAVANHNHLVPSRSVQARLIKRINDIITPLLYGSSVIVNGKVGHHLSLPIAKDLKGCLCEYNSIVLSPNQPSIHGTRQQRRRSRRKATTVTRNNPKIISTNPYDSLSSDE
jgi:hypothetical protein